MMATSKALAQPGRLSYGCAKAFDVAIIPYLQNQQVRNANPLKLREYLATGKPIVSVPTPEVDRFANVLHVAEGREAFLAAMELALLENTPELCAARMAAVREMSWEHRAQTALGIAMSSGPAAKAGS